LLARGLELGLGRRNLARLGRFLSNEARLDVDNAMASNGELALLDVVASQQSGRALVLDVGANLGEWSAAVLDRFGERVEVHAFEPCAGTRRRLEEELRQHRLGARVRVFPQALSDVSGETTLLVVGDGEGRNSLTPGLLGATREERVPTTTLDEHVRLQDAGEILLVKVDAEGHDLRVLAGARGLLSRRAIGLVQFEYNHRWVHERRFLRDAFELLQPLGYQLGKVTPRGIERYRGWHPELESFREGNYLAFTDAWADRLPRVAWWNE
jgi:FkbM family methyltransferase